MFDWISTLVEQGGLAGIALAMFLENVFPPIPSEVIMPVAGSNAARGDASLILVIIAGSIGSLAGALLWYWIGAAFGADRLKDWSRRHGRWLTLTPSDIDDAVAWFDRYGGIMVFVGRMIPGVRTLISVPAGFMGMGLGRFIVYSAIGTVLWTAGLTGAGYWLQGNSDQVATWLNPVSTAVIVILVAVYLWRVVTFDKRVERQESRSGAGS